MIITFEPGRKKNALGWIVNRKEWTQNGTERYNINISSDCLDRSVYQIISTLVHEMCHLYNIQHDVQDCSRSGKFHNLKFKDVAERHGLIVTKSDKYGWNHTECSEALRLWIDDNIPFTSLQLCKLVFAEDEKPKKPKQSSRKYICPSCGLIVRATKECRIICGDCEEEMSLDD